MADISKLILPDNSEYDIKDSISRRDRIHIVVGTQTTTTSAWTGKIDVDELYDGLTMLYYLPCTSGSAEVSINLTLTDDTTTGAIKAYYTGSSTFKTVYAAGSAILFTYWSAGAISINGVATTTASWRRADYSVLNTNTIGEYAGSCVAGAGGMARYSLILQTAPNTWESVVTTSSTGTSKVKSSSGFLLTSPILYQNAGTYTSGNASSQSGCWSTTYNVDTRYSFNVSNTWTVAGRPIYLVGTINNGKFYLKDTKWWSDTAPATNDGYYYWYIGQTSDKYRISLYPVHPIFYHNGTELIQYLPGDAATVTGHTVETNVPPNAVFTDTTYSLATTSSDGLMSYTDKLKLAGIGGTYNAETETITFELGQAPDIEQITSGVDFRVQLLQALQNVAWINGNGNMYYNNLLNALYPAAQAYITVSYTPTTTVFTDDNLDILKNDLVVTYYADQGVSGVVLDSSDYELSGTLNVGSNTITVTYAIYTETFTVSNVLTNLAASFDNWTLSYDAVNTTTISDGVLTTGCATQAQYDSWAIWIADCKYTLWSSVVNKTAHFRIKAKKRTNTQSNGRLQITATCFANASVTSMVNANRKSAVINAMAPNNTNMTVYDGTFSVVFSNLNQGSLQAPTSDSTFGLLIYAWTLDYFDIYEVKMGVSS